MFTPIGKKILRFLFLIFIPFGLYAEGIRELRPDSTVSAADLYLTTSSAYSDFGLINCAPNYRLYIHVKNPGESILMGLNTLNHNSTYHYNLRKPDGTIVMTGLCPYNTGVTGYIQYYKQAIKGPFPSIGGYTPLEYQVNNVADTGDYYFEIFSTNYYNTEYDLPLWDFQVVSGAHTPAQPSDTINGRVWSQSWQFQAELGSYRTFNSKFFVYSDDGIVTKLKFTNGRVGVLTIFCNPSGCVNTGNFLSDRKSVALNTFINFPGIADYKVFLNNPDPAVYPSGIFGSITGTPALIEDPAFPPCSIEKQVVFDVNKAGNAEVDLSFPYGAPATNVSLFSVVTAGTNHIAWNGKDGLGNPVPDGTTVYLKVIYMNGLTNLPIWDQEQNPQGYKITLVRPFISAFQYPRTFWDDTNITGYGCPVGSNLSGCIPFPNGCHTWSGSDCHDKMINTWWYGGSDTAMAVAYFSGMPAQAIGHDSARCGPGSVTLHATVPPTETVDWYDSFSAGNLLLAGDTTFVTPIISVNTTFFAEARNDSTNCTSATRTPVTAFILSAPSPHIAGPDQACPGSQDNEYFTDPSMSNYTWTVSPGNIITSGYLTDHIFVSWLVPGIQQVNVNYTNATGCPGSRPARLYVQVTPKPDSAGPVNGPPQVCAETNNVIYSIAPVPFATSYTWTVPAGVQIVSGAGTDSITVNFLPASQSGYFSVFASDSCGDGAPSHYPVMIIQRPVANAGPNDTICQGQHFQVNGAVASGYDSLLWTTNGSGSLSDDTTLSPLYYPAPGETGQVIFTLVAYGKGNCGNDTSRMKLKISAAPVISAGKDTSVCEGRSFQVTGASALNVTSVYWTSSGSGYFNDPQRIDPVYFPGSGDIASGHAMLTLYGMSYYPCCLGSDFIKLSIVRGPVVNAGPVAITCASFPIAISGASASGYDSLRWTHNGQGSLTGEQSLTPVYLPAAAETGTILLTLTAYGQGACSDSIVRSQTSVRIYPAVTADAGPDRMILPGAVDTLQGYGYGGSGRLGYSWEPGSLFLDSTLLNPVTIPLSADTTFVLIVSDSITGCKATDTLRIRIRLNPSPEVDCLMVYNVITPNGDGKNDNWIIDCIENYPDNIVRIFNIWGDLVNIYNHYDNVAQVWKGTNLDGQPVPDGTYYYVISIKEMKPLTGWVLVRAGWKH